MAATLDCLQCSPVEKPLKVADSITIEPSFFLKCSSALYDCLGSFRVPTKATFDSFSSVSFSGSL